MRRFGKRYKRGEAGHGTDKVGVCKRLGQKQIRCRPAMDLSEVVLLGQA